MVENNSNEQGIYPMCSKEDDWSHVLCCKGTVIWNDRIFDKRLRNIDAEIGGKGIVGRKKTDGMTEYRKYMIKYKEK
jgi:hypothetical protein